MSNDFLLPPCRAVLFDLDGTVLNTNNLIIQSFQYVFKKINSETIPREKIISCFGEPLSTSLQRLSPTNWEEMLEEYRNYSILHHDELTELFQGVKECLGCLKIAGFKLGIVTSKLRKTAYRGLDLFELTEYFDVVVGMEDTNNHKPLPDPVVHGCQLLGILPSEAVMIGDSAFDIKSAKAAGASAIGVSWSMNEKELLLQAGADGIIDSFNDLNELLCISR